MSKRNRLSSHDKFFKTSMSQVKIATDFFKAHLPGELKKHIQWASLELQSGSYINERYASHYSDVLYKVSISNEQGYLYVLAEHQSKPDRLMPLRLWNYMCCIWEQHITQGSDEQDELPLIYPVVLCHGKKSPYPYSMDFFDLFKHKQLAQRMLLNCPFSLIDLTVMSDDQLCKNGYATVLELLQKHIYKRGLINVFKKIVKLGWLPRLEKLSSGDYVLKLITYAIEKGEVSLEEGLLEMLTNELPNEREKIMTLADHLRREGMQQGIEQAKLEVAKNMLSRGEKMAYISEITGIAEEMFAGNEVE